MTLSRLAQTFAEESKMKRLELIRNNTLTVNNVAIKNFKDYRKVKGNNENFKEF